MERTWNQPSPYPPHLTNWDPDWHCVYGCICMHYAGYAHSQYVILQTASHIRIHLTLVRRSQNKKFWISHASCNSSMLLTTVRSCIQRLLHLFTAVTNWCMLFAVHHMQMHCTGINIWDARDERHRWWISSINSIQYWSINRDKHEVTAKACAAGPTLATVAIASAQLRR